MSDEKALDVEAGPVTVRTKGYRIGDLGLIAIAFGVGWLILADWTRAGDSKDEKKSTAVAIEKSQKETNEKFDKMIEQLRQGNENQSIANCLLALPPDRRNQDAAALCERIVRVRGIPR